MENNAETKEIKERKDSKGLNGVIIFINFIFLIAYKYVARIIEINMYINYRNNRTNEMICNVGAEIVNIATAILIVFVVINILIIKITKSKNSGLHIAYCLVLYFIVFMGIFFANTGWA